MKNTITGCTYKHPKLPISEFNDSYFNLILQQISSKKNNVFVMGDININLLGYHSDADIAN